MRSNNQRRADLDPEDPVAAARAESEERRTGAILWGGRDIAGKKVWVETVTYNYHGTVLDLRNGVLWLSDATRVYNDSEDGPIEGETRKAGTLSFPGAVVTMVALKGELSWW